MGLSEGLVSSIDGPGPQSDPHPGGNLCTCIFMYAYVYAYLLIYVYTFIDLYVCMCVRVPTCARTSGNADGLTCTRTCVRVHVCIACSVSNVSSMRLDVQVGPGRGGSGIEVDVPPSWGAGLAMPA